MKVIGIVRHNLGHIRMFIDILQKEHLFPNIR